MMNIIIYLAKKQSWMNFTELMAMHSVEEYMQFFLGAHQKRGSLGRLKMLTRFWKSNMH